MFNPLGANPTKWSNTLKQFWSVFSSNTGKYGPEITPYLDTFHAVYRIAYNLNIPNSRICMLFHFNGHSNCCILQGNFHFDFLLFKKPMLVSDTHTKMKNMKQPAVVLCEKWYSYKFHKIHWKTPVLEYFFNKVAGLRPKTFLKKRPKKRHFPVNFAKFLRTPIL